ncbi:MAG: VWA domain-containing protein [Vicinamibacterales bacterium]|nr:VWA domain-containing protein [Vicinamibacterales bacterium]
MSPLKLLPAGLAATLVANVVTIAILAAQQPRSVGEAPVGDAAIHTVRIDAIAVDARGSAISTLTPRDFHLREDGRLVAIDDAQFLNNSPRFIAIYLDEYHITAGASADWAREALAEFVNREIGPRDLIAVMKPLDSLYSIRLTDNVQDARRIIAGLEGRKGDYTPRTAYERSYMAGSTDRIETERTQVAISALNALAEQMGSLSNVRKTLVVVTEGFDAPARRRGQEYLATIDSAIRSANRANVAIYPIDPRPASEGDGSPNEALRSLADETDGRIVTDAPAVAELVSAIRAAVAEADGYYMLTYRSKHKEDGTFHPVEVRVKRERVQVRARSGYWAPSANDRLGAELLARGSGAPVVRLDPPRRISPLIQPWFGLSLGNDGKTRMTFVWEPSIAVPGDRARPIAARLELTVFGAGDAVVFEGPVLPTGPGRVEAAGSEPLRAVFDAAPGPLRLRMKIQDASRQEVDSDVREIAVRDLRGAVVIGTPKCFRARNAREFRTLDSAPEAVPVSSRQFSRTERLLVRFPAYAPDGQQPSVSARLLNRLGQPMRTLEVRAAADGGHEIDIMLAGLATGDYQLELSATSPAGHTTEVVGFRVTS